MESRSTLTCLCQVTVHNQPWINHDNIASQTRHDKKMAQNSNLYFGVQGATNSWASSYIHMHQEQSC